MSKYKTHVGIQTVASTSIGEVEFDTIEEYYEKAAALWESQGYENPMGSYGDGFDLGDWDLCKVAESDLPYLINNDKG